ncbi:hypothetical protein J2Z79_000638 [Symbiobacterium terraclitae]|uniref:Uncharacterized protein n=1 Tax=Symbiobacterium terraclitae TaxID=557451 RepID=A0ABS4JP03_9FIRM|nr:hypothetical protein [Symbiobacterium terraclitae]
MPSSCAPPSSPFAFVAAAERSIPADASRPPSSGGGSGFQGKAMSHPGLEGGSSRYSCAWVSGCITDSSPQSEVFRGGARGACARSPGWLSPIAHWLKRKVKLHEPPRVGGWLIALQLRPGERPHHRLDAAVCGVPRGARGACARSPGWLPPIAHWLKRKVKLHEPPRVGGWLIALQLRPGERPHHRLDGGWVIPFHLHSASRSPSAGGGFPVLRGRGDVRHYTFDL